MEVFQRKDLLKLYFKDVRSIPLLRPEEEIKLGRGIKNGDKKALNKLVEGNLRFVVKVAKGYQGNGLPLSDLINEGNIGLIKAAKRFNPERGVKFISYAIWWVRQAIIQSLREQTRIIRLPVHQERCLAKVEKAFFKLTQELKRSPTPDEIAQEISGSAKEVETILEMSEEHLSLDMPINDDVAVLGDMVPGRDYQKLSMKMEMESLRTSLEQIIGVLPSREKEVIKFRYGLKGGEPMTLKEIGKKMGVSKERVRQIEVKAIEKLRKEVNQEGRSKLQEIMSLAA